MRGPDRRGRAAHGFPPGRPNRLALASVFSYSVWLTAPADGGTAMTRSKEDAGGDTAQSSPGDTPRSAGPGRPGWLPTQAPTDPDQWEPWGRNPPGLPDTELFKIRGRCLMSITYRLVDFEGEMLSDADTIEYLKGILGHLDAGRYTVDEIARSHCHRATRLGGGDLLKFDDGTIIEQPDPWDD